MYPHFCSGNDYSIVGLTMIGIATAMIGLRGRMALPQALNGLKTIAR